MDKRAKQGYVSMPCVVVRITEVSRNIVIYRGALARLCVKEYP